MTDPKEYDYRMFRSLVIAVAILLTLFVCYCHKVHQQAQLYAQSKIK